MNGAWRRGKETDEEIHECLKNAIIGLASTNSGANTPDCNPVIRPFNIGSDGHTGGEYGSCAVGPIFDMFAIGLSVLQNYPLHLKWWAEIEQYIDLANGTGKKTKKLYQPINKLRNSISNGVSQFAFRVCPDEVVWTTNPDKYKHVIHDVDMKGDE